MIAIMPQHHFTVRARRGGFTLSPATARARIWLRDRTDSRRPPVFETRAALALFMRHVEAHGWNVRDATGLGGR